ncbi:MAG: hypothetical protein ACLP4W_04680 [Mycobacterium sp.]|uniref:hypothetical protein n=1 Tax=Mycobacterium sp. TaxID=1785 RepID=UPI003F9DB066
MEQLTTLEASFLEAEDADRRMIHQVTTANTKHHNATGDEGACFKHRAAGAQPSPVEV